MSLSDRLAAAAAARGDAVPTSRIPPKAPPPTPEAVRGPAPEFEARHFVPPMPKPVASHLPLAKDGRRRIVAAASMPVTAVDPDPSAPPDGVCPTCGRTGELGMVDLPGRTADWSCFACHTLWQVPLAAPAEHPSEP